MDQELNKLVGEWEIGGNHPQMGELHGLGRMWFEWMVGEKWLVQRWQSGKPEFPSGVSVIGPVEESNPGSYQQNYFDSRGVHRVYEMTMRDGIWTLERSTEEDDFWQRFRADVGEDLISGSFEIAERGGEYEHDFAIEYRRVS
jgi:hypothetical protein